MKKILITMAVALGMVTTTAQADFLGVYVGAGIWKHDPSGSFESTDAASSSIDLSSDLGMTDDSEGYFYAAFEHPVPMVPNVRIESTSLTSTGTTAGTFNFGGTAESGDSTISLDSMDTVLYWRILDNWVNFDIGFNMRKFDGEFTLGTQTKSISETIPLVYMAAQFDLPFTGLSVGGDYNIIVAGDNSLDDMRIRVLYEMGVIGVEAGIRNTSITLDSVDGVNADMSFDGMFFGAYVHF